LAGDVAGFLGLDPQLRGKTLLIKADGVLKGLFADLGPASIGSS